MAIRTTIYLENDVSQALKTIYKRHGDNTWHIHQALISYGPIKKVLGGKFAPKQSTRFVKPSYREVNHLFMGKGFEHDKALDEATKFLDHYESNGWKVGKNPMKSWQAAVRNWIKRSKDNGKPKQSTYERVQAACGEDETLMEEITPSIRQQLPEPIRGHSERELVADIQGDNPRSDPSRTE